MPHAVLRGSTIRVCVLALLGCSGSDGKGATGPGGMTPGPGAPADGGAGNGPSFTLPGAPGGGAGGGGPAAGGSSGGTTLPCLQGKEPSCAGQDYMGQGLPVDIHLMFDQSGSMAIMDDGQIMRLDAVRGAVDQFVNAPESRDLGLGIAYFGQQPLSCACTSCNPADYARPAVPLALLPGNAGAIMASLRGIEPTGETPTGAAIRGACSYAKGRKQADPSRNPVVLLVTDGEPKAPLSASKGGCNPTLEDATAAAAECTAAGIKTYVLGVGPSLQNLNQIAQAGGTGQAYLVASGGGAEILRALNSIRQDAMIPCTLQIPGAQAGGVVDPEKVNVVYSSASCASVTTFLNVKQADGCNTQQGGWYYDSPARPTRIQLCPATCEAVKAPGGQLRISVGCITQVID